MNAEEEQAQKDEINNKIDTIQSELDGLYRELYSAERRYQDEERCLERAKAAEERVLSQTDDDESVREAGRYVIHWLFKTGESARDLDYLKYDIQRCKSELESLRN